MIDFDSALKRRIDLLSNIVGDYKTAADFGCGTGIDSIALSKLGLRTDAFDQSEEMIARAKSNASKYNADIKFFSCPLEDITSPNMYDLIVSLGNTMANLNVAQLKKTLGICKTLLNKGGRITIQILNFNLITENIHIINENETSKYKVTRYYEKDGNGLQFKIKIIDKINETEKLIETSIFPHTMNLLIQILNDMNFKVNFFGGLDLRRFEISKSKDLVAVAEKE
jgi:cyclopropane fatty-acyl-phospholipid synthase-like methyltransferase